MISGIQAVIMGFAVIMFFMTYHYYRRSHFRKKDLLLWASVWGLLFIAGLFPESISVFIQSLNIERGMDFFTIFGFIFLLIVVFYLYSIIFKMQKKIEAIVSAVSLKTRHKRKK